jgi:hypothetical protein
MWSDLRVDFRDWPFRRLWPSFLGLFLLAFGITQLQDAFMLRQTEESQISTRQATPTSPLPSASEVLAPGQKSGTRVDVSSGGPNPEGDPDCTDRLCSVGPITKFTTHLYSPRLVPGRDPIPRVLSDLAADQIGLMLTLRRLANNNHAFNRQRILWDVSSRRDILRAHAERLSFLVGSNRPLPLQRPDASAFAAPTARFPVATPVGPAEISPEGPGLEGVSNAEILDSHGVPPEAPATVKGMKLPASPERKELIGADWTAFTQALTGIVSVIVGIIVLVFGDNLRSRYVFLNRSQDRASDET